VQAAGAQVQAKQALDNLEQLDNPQAAAPQQGMGGGQAGGDPMAALMQAMGGQGPAQGNAPQGAPAPQAGPGQPMPPM